MRFLSTLFASFLGSLVALGLIVFLGFIILFAIATSTEQAPRVRPGSVLVVEIPSAIEELSASDPFAEAFLDDRPLDLNTIKKAIQYAGYDARIDAIWIKARATNVSWAMLQEIRNELVAFKATGKPIIASSEDHYLNESGYFLASVADAIYASTEAPIEFNGFFIAAEFYKDLLDNLEIEPQVIRAGKYKSAVEPFLQSSLSPENREQLMALIQAQHNVFLETVAKSRDLSIEEVTSLMDEDVLLTATDAYNAGLLDGLLYLDEVEDEILARIEKEEDDDLRTTSLRSYSRVSASNAGVPEFDSSDDIAVVYAVGAIVPGSSGYSANPLMGGNLVGSATFGSALRRAADNENIKAIVVRISSPGGSASASDAMRREIAQAAANKPVVISMGSVAASGGYWMATAGDTIVANELTTTGSIGVFSLMFNTSRMFDEKLGIAFDVVRTGPYADMYSGVRGFSDQEIRLLGKTTDETYASFLELVSESRDLTIEEADAVAQGRIWSGRDALNVGLVDELGGLDRAIEIAAEMADLEENSFGIRYMPRPKSMFERLEDSINTRLAHHWMSRFLPGIKQHHFDRMDQVQSLLDTHGQVQALLPFRFQIK